MTNMTLRCVTGNAGRELVKILILLIIDIVKARNLDYRFPDINSTRNPVF